MWSILCENVLAGAQRNFRKEAACPGERCEQTDSKTLLFFLTSLNKRNVELVGPDWEWGEKRVGSLQLERD